MARFVPSLATLLCAGSLAAALAACSPPVRSPDTGRQPVPPADSSSVPLAAPPLVLTPSDTVDVPPAPRPGIRRVAVAPPLYVDSGPCPGRGCRATTSWRTRFRVELYARPDTTSGLVHVLASGVLVMPAARQVHTVPAPFIARRSAQMEGMQAGSPVRARHAAGDTLWVLAYHGDGRFRVMLSNGAILDDYSLGFSPIGGTAGRRCERTSKCWGTLARTLESTTWIRLRADDGREGWTNQAGAFEIPN